MLISIHVQLNLKSAEKDNSAEEDNSAKKVISTKVTNLGTAQWKNKNCLDIDGGDKYKCLAYACNGKYTYDGFDKQFPFAFFNPFCKSGTGCCSEEYFKIYLPFVCCDDYDANWGETDTTYPNWLASKTSFRKNIIWAHNGALTKKCKTNPDSDDCDSNYGCCSMQSYCAMRSYMGTTSVIDYPWYKNWYADAVDADETCQSSFCNYGSNYYDFVCFGL